MFYVHVYHLLFTGTNVKADDYDDCEDGAVNLRGTYFLLINIHVYSYVFYIWVWHVNGHQSINQQSNNLFIHFFIQLFNQSINQPSIQAS